MTSTPEVTLTYVVWCGHQHPHPGHRWYATGYSVRCPGITESGTLDTTAPQLDQQLPGQPDQD